ANGAFDFSMDYIDPDGPGTLTASLDGHFLAKLDLEPGRSSLSLTGMELSHGQHALKLDWTGSPESVEGKLFRSSGNLEAYLLFSRPALKKAGP
ncbi:MAG TPA: hypothetical protein VIK22_00630, partial [Candidatus Anoxymicrobiaceae bacterium]